jgi:hypothetical protein
MTEPQDRDESPHGESAGLYDRDLNIKAVVITGVALALGTAVVFALMWGFYLGLKQLDRAKDLPPSPIPEANIAQPPPEPRLQESPGIDLQRLRAEEERILTTYGWVDREAGIVRIPIENAIDLLAETGLPVKEDVEQAVEEIFGDSAAGGGAPRQ